MNTASKTIFITGASSGIGKAITNKFLAEGWNVVATMRSPREQVTNQSEHLLVLPLDVTKPDEISVAHQAAKKHFGTIDVLVNNAGYGSLGPIDSLDDAAIHSQFEVNVFGLLGMTREVLPDFRERNTGTIINISSMYGKLTMPYFGIYAATKHAVEAISESLHQELIDTNITVQTIRPGAIKTKFFTNAIVRDLPADNPNNPRYKNFIENISKKGNSGADPKLVANAVYKAANSNVSGKRYLTDNTGRLLLLLYSSSPFRLYSRLIKQNLG